MRALPVPFYRGLVRALVVVAALALPLALRSQTVLNGSYSGTPVTGDIQINGGTSATFSSGFSFTGTNALLLGSSTLFLNETVTFTSKAFTLGTGSTLANVDLGPAYTLTFGTGTTATGAFNINGATGSTIINQGAISATAGTNYLYGAAVTNASGGTISVSGGATLNLGYNNGETITNSSGGTITASGSGTTLNLHQITNLGSVQASNGAIIYETGTISSTDLGNISLSSGGRVVLEALVNNSGTFTAPTGGTYELWGTISGGTIAAGAVTFYPNNGAQLDNTIWTGDLIIPTGNTVNLSSNATFTGANLSIANGATFVWSNNSTLSGKTITIGSGSSLGNILVNNSITFNIGAGTTLTGVMNFTGAGGSGLYNQGTITQNAGTGYLYLPTATNASGGTIAATNGATLYYGYNNGEYTANAGGGTLLSSGAGSVLYVHNLQNFGTVSATNNGVVNFTGTANTAGSIGSVQLSSGGRALLSGQFDNSATTINAPSGGSLELFGGTITNGTIAAGALTFTTSGGTLSGVTYNGNLVLPTSTSVTFTNGTSFTGTTATLNDYSNLYWNQNGTLNNAAVTFGSGGNYAQLVVGSGNTLTIGSGSTLSGYAYQIYGNSGSTIINQGAVNYSKAGVSEYFYAPTLTNASGGTITASAGTLNLGYYTGESLTNAAGGVITATGSGTMINLHEITNNGTINAASGGIVDFTGTTNNIFGLGTVNLSGGGRALLGGTFNNTSFTLNAPNGGQYELYGGTINNGAIAAGALTFTGSGGTLNGLIYNGNLTLPASSAVTFTGGTDFTGTAATIGDYATLYWNQNAALSNKAVTFGSAGNYGQIVVGANNTLTIGSGSSLTGYAYQIYGNSGAAIINQGSITYNKAGVTEYLYAPTLTNASGGTITASAGTVNVGYYNGETLTNAAGGVITATGSGTVLNLHNIVNLGTIYSNSAGIVQFTGTTNIPANLGIVNLTGGGRALLNGTFDNTSTTISAPVGGQFELAGGTISNGTIAAGAMTFTSSGGTLSAATFTGNLLLPASSTVTFTNGATFTGSAATISDYATLYWNQNAALTGKTVTFGSAGNYGQLVVGSNNTLTIGAGSTLTGYAYQIYGNSGATIVNQGAVNYTQGGVTEYFYAPTLTNASGGTISASAGTLLLGYYNGEVLTNAAGGAISSTGSGTYVVMHNIVNNGSISASNGGIVEFTGTGNATGNLGSVSLSSGGRALLAGTLNNAASTLNAPSGGLYELYGGTISGGTIASGALSFTSSGGTLDGVTYIGNFIMPASTNVTFVNGTTFGGSLATIGDYATLYWNQNGALTGKSITFGSAGNYGQIAVGANDTFTIGSGTSLTGYIYQLYGNSGSSIVNQGSISYTQPSATEYLYAPTLTNANGGTISASAGTLYLGYYNGEVLTNASGGTISATGSGTNIVLHNLVNQGVVSASSGAVLQFSGNSNTTASLGAVDLTGGGRALLTGFLDNTAATLNSVIGGSFELYGGTLNNGTVASGALNFTNYGGTLNAVSLLGDLNLPSASSYVTMLGGTSFAGTNLNLANSAGIYWQQTGALVGKNLTFGSGAFMYLNAVGSSLTLDPTTTLTGSANLYTDGSTGTSITNQGTINQTTGSGSMFARTFTNAGTINVTGGTAYLGTSTAGYTFQNQTGATIAVNGGTVSLQSAMTNGGTINVQSGTLSGGSYLTNGSTGTIMGSGTISGGLTMAGGILAPGNSVGTLTLSGGAFNVTGASTLNIEISGATSDKILFQSPTSNVNLGSGLLSLNVLLLSAPTNGTTYTILSIPSGPMTFTGTFAGLPNTGDSFISTFGTQDYNFSVNYLSNSVTLNFTPVPEPGTYALLGSGLAVLGLGLVRRRRSKSDSAAGH